MLLVMQDPLLYHHHHLPPPVQSFFFLNVPFPISSAAVWFPGVFVPIVLVEPQRIPGDASQALNRPSQALKRNAPVEIPLQTDRWTVFERGCLCS